MASKSRLCLICGQVLDSDEARREHLEHEHPGQRVAWRDKRPWIVAANGTETRIGAAALKRMRAAARAQGGHAGRTSNRRPVAARRRAPAAEPEAPMVEQPHEPGDAPYFAQTLPPYLDALGRPAPGPDPEAEADEDATEPEMADETATRDSIRVALDQGTLAEMIRNVSIMISEWDGAGVAGHLSRTEAAQLAMLLHEPTVDVVARYMGGSVNRFRLALAAVIILLGKGRIHLSAIRAQRMAAMADDAGEQMTGAWAATLPEQGEDVAPEPPAETDPIAELAARQREWATTPRTEV